jgi:hypothetical protein
MSRVAKQSLAILMLGFITFGSANAEEAASKVSSPRPGVHKRIVLLKFKDGTSPQKIDQLIQGIRALGPQ